MASILSGKRILLGVTGGVAAFKAVALASSMAQAGARVSVVMTEAAEHFITPLQFASVTANPVYTDLWTSERKPGHIALSDDTDLAIIAPATANTLAKLAHGLADNLLTGVLLAYPGPVLLAPAMNTGMWNAPAVQRNVAILRADGRHFVGPDVGHLACGASGTGRMAEPEDIFAAAAAVLAGTYSQTKDMSI